MAPRALLCQSARMSVPTPQTAGDRHAAPRGAQGVELIIMLAGLMALNAMAIDTMLPALDAMARDLGVAGSNRIQLIIGTYLIGMGVGSLIHGPLSDRFGRRSMLLWTLLGYVACALGCALARDFTALLVWRLISGLLAAGLGVIAIAIVRDRMAGDQMARTTSLIFMIFMIVPVIAPSIGMGVLLVGSWRSIFLLLTILGAAMALWLWLRLDETLDPADKAAIDPVSIARNWMQVVRHRTTIGYMAGGALIQGALYGFLTSAAQLFSTAFGSAAAIPWAFAAVATTMACSNFLNSRIVMRFGARRIAHGATMLFILLGLIQIIIAPHVVAQPFWLLVPLALNMAMVGLIGSNFGAIAMTPFGHIAGTAASFQQASRTIVAALLGSAIGQQFDGTSRPMAWAFFLCGAGCLLLVWWAERGRLFTRPGTTHISSAA